ncbi:3-oxoacyl-ACP synthase III family protein [Streptomyces melanogenes]|uniref:3-oxoacyl-ACP synthase III family protein n=1 Tax=Streptomyces melanogenes TaxID=67326 RepID=UPI0037BB83B5
MVANTAAILATGSYVPKEEISNEEVAARCGVTAEWIERKTEIRSRRYAPPHLATSDLAARAGAAALEAAGLDAGAVDYLIVSTSTGDSPQPPTSALVQHALGAYGAACLDVNAVCSGFVHALELARGLVALRPGARALVIAADVYSRILDLSDRRTAPLFGDGAGAALVGAAEQGYGILDTDLTTSGGAHHLIRVEAGGSRLPASAETVAEGAHYFRMEGRAVRAFVNENVPPALRRLVERTGHRLADVDHFIPHQANGVMMRELVEASGLTQAAVHRTVERYGNTGSASIAVTLDEANRAGLLHRGELVLLAGFGGGMAAGSTLLTWQGEAA